LRKYLPSAQIFCLDVSARCLKIGQARFGDLARFVLFDRSRMPLGDDSVDIALAACVYTT
jgi:ubiquinone/menaquinone biosynthesis C-methylase UbiE